MKSHVRPARQSGYGRLILISFALGLGSGGALVATLGLDPPRLAERQASAGPETGTDLEVDAGVEPLARDLPDPPPPELAAADVAAARPRPRLRPSPPTAPVIVAGNATVEIRMRRGEALVDALVRAGVTDGEAHEAARSLRPVYDPRRLKAGQAVTLDLGAGTEGGGTRRLLGLALVTGPADMVRLERDGGGAFAARGVERPLRRDTVRVAARITDNLQRTARRADLPREALAEMVKLLSWDVDLQREIRPGDRFEVVLDRLVNDEGQPVRAQGGAGGGLLFAGLDLRDRRIEAYRFTGRDGQAGYYDGQGRALRRWLLRTPVDGARLSSLFGPRRHPILRFTRMHKGVDFAAPPGAPVYAAGDGEVEFVGRNRGHGKYVRLRHHGEYASAYAHLSRFAAGLARGKRVRQGQVIGYVGSTGLSTGPHLHYEVLRAGVQVDPLGLKGEGFAETLEGQELRRFRQVRAEIDALRRNGPGSAGQVVVENR